jgi:nucleoside diphosphate kinase
MTALEVAAATATESDTDVPAGLASAVTVCEAKAEAYRRDPYFRAAAGELLDPAGTVEPGRLDGLLARTLLVFKPDAVAGRRVRPVLDGVAEAGFAVVGYTRFRFSPLLIRELWRYQFNIASADRAVVVDILLPAADSLAVVLEDRDWRTGALPAAYRLGDVKGPADPRLRRPEHLRSRLAAPTTLFNFVHTADEPADLLREAALLDLAAGSRLMAAAAAPRPSRPTDGAELADLVSGMEADLPAHDLDALAATARLRARDRYADLLPGPDGQLPWRAVLERCPHGRVPDEDRWDLLAIATAQIESNVAGLRPLLPTIKSADWRTAARRNA